jgi:hypothetical protein
MEGGKGSDRAQNNKVATKDEGRTHIHTHTHTHTHTHIHTTHRARGRRARRRALQRWEGTPGGPPPWWGTRWGAGGCVCVCQVGCSVLVCVKCRGEGIYVVHILVGSLYYSADCRVCLELRSKPRGWIHATNATPSPKTSTPPLNKHTHTHTQHPIPLTPPFKHTHHTPYSSYL